MTPPLVAVGDPGDRADGSPPRTTVDPLAIVGIGCLFPKAAGVGFYWANLKHGVDCITPVPPTHWNPDEYYDPDPKKPDMTYARRGGFLDVVEFDPLEYGIAPRDIEATDTTQLLGLVAAKQALADAGIVFADSRAAHDGSPLRPDQAKVVERSRVSVILGVTGTLELVIPLGARLGHPKWRRAMRDAGIPEPLVEDAVARIAESYVPWQENSFPGLLGNVVAGRIANRLDLHGTNCVVDAACASSLSAIHLAALELQTGRADVVVTGGCDTFNDIFMFMCFSKTPALSPSGDARPFDAEGDGTILGEGLGVVVLKRLADAVRAGDTVYAVLRGIGTSSDGKGHAIYAPSAEGQKRCLRSAYEQAGISPATVELVEAHGTGTRVGDATEAAALIDVYSAAAPDRPRPWCALGSVKSQIGHTKAAAGAASLIKVALALYYKVLPPTIKVTRPVEPLAAPDCPFYLNTTMRPWLPRPDHPRRAALSAFGFGGSNFHAILEEFDPVKPAPDWDGSVEIVALGASDPAALAAALDRLPTDWPAFARAAEQTRSSFDPAATCRLAFAAHRTLTDLPQLVATARDRLTRDPEAPAWETAAGVCYARGAPPGGLAILFPGQGSQAVGMLREWACLFPEMLECLAAADAVGATEAPGPLRLSDRIYPPPVFDPTARARQEAELRDTRWAQPALGAVSLGAWRVLHDRFGLTADAFAGHSYGELVALAAAGRLTPAELFRLSFVRGRLMASGRAGDPGAMLAVLAPLAEVERYRTEQGLDVVVANHNAPEQVVLSGPTAAVARAEQVFAAAGVRTVRLPVAAAFHSPLVSDAVDPFREALAAVPVAPGAAPVYANATAAVYPAAADAARALLAEQIARPVRFVEQVRAMLDAGVRTFLEVGPGTVLTKLVDAVRTQAGAADAVAWGIDPGAGRVPAVLHLGQTLARLAARGYAIRLAEWERGSRCRLPTPADKPGRTVPLTGANYVAPRPRRPPAPPARLVPVPAAPSPDAPRPDSVAPTMPPPADSNDPWAQALLLTQQSLATLQRLQEQTAALHKQFLDAQEAAQRTLHALVEQQAALLGAALGLALTSPAARAAAPPPVPAPAATPASAPLPAPGPSPQTTAAVPSSPVPPVTTPAGGLPPSPPTSPPAPPVVPPAAPPSPPPSATARPALLDSVASVVLAVVSERTGYPVESLDLGLSLDADLGVDSIKRVEILSALQERLPGAPAVRPEHLGRLHTLRDLAEFLSGQGAGTAPPAATVTPPDSEAKPVSSVRREAQLPTRSEPVLPDGLPRPTAAAPSPAGSPADVASVVLAVVSERTGYPVESLDLGLSLDADLGVDSIKRVEILSALQERLPGAPAVRPEHLGRLHTLRDLAEFLARTPERPADPATTRIPIIPLEPKPPSAPVTPLVDVPPPPDPDVPATEPVSAINPPVLTGPSAALHPPSDWLRPPAPRGAEVTARGPAGVVPEQVDRSILQAVDLDPEMPRPLVPLPARGEFIVVGERDALTGAVAEGLAGHSYHAKLFGWEEPPVSPGGNLAGLVLIAPLATPDDVPLNRRAFEWLKLTGPRLRQTARTAGAVVVTVARLDGSFGLANLGPDADPTSGGLAGLVKTVRHEWPEVHCKALDLSPEFTEPQAAAAAIVEEILAAGPLEVGLAPTHRCTLELARTVRRPSSQLISLGPRDVILVTGGARGVTAEVAVALAETYSATLILTGRTPPPGPEPSWLAGVTGEADLKRVISRHLGPEAGPRAVGEFYQRVVAQREVRRTLDRLAATGAKAVYYPVDVTDAKAVADLVQQIRVRHGPITAVVHGAGVLADKRIEDLTPEQFDAVYATKVEGLRNVLESLGQDELKALVLFSSTTARFGRMGQVAYACANEVLNKTAQVEARRRPRCRVVAINWGPWEGGMVTPALRTLFEREGVGLIPLAEGAVFLIQELNAACKSVEVVALARQRGGGSGVTRLPAPPAPVTPAPSVAAGSAPAGGELSLAFERTVDVATHPILQSHVLADKAVLPLVIHLEWLAHAALHSNPGLVFHGFNDLRVTVGVQVEPGGAVPLRAYAGKAVKQDKTYVVPVELRGKRRDGREQVHSRAEVVLVSAYPSAPPEDPPPPVAPLAVSVDRAYQELLFHGPDLRGIERIEGASETAVIGRALPAPPPGEWFQFPLRSAWLADPLVLDASFQMVILWTQLHHQSGSLPCFVGRYRQYRRSFPAAPTTVIVRIRRSDGSFVRADIDYLDPDGRVIALMQDYECVIEKSLNQSFRKNQFARS